MFDSWSVRIRIRIWIWIRSRICVRIMFSCKNHTELLFFWCLSLVQVWFRIRVGSTNPTGFVFGLGYKICVRLANPIRFWFIGFRNRIQIFNRKKINKIYFFFNLYFKSDLKNQSQIGFEESILFYIFGAIFRLDLKSALV